MVNQMENWRTNLMCVSETHSLVVFAVKSDLHFYSLCPLTFELGSLILIKKLNNDNAVINNIRCVQCATYDFLITVDEGAFVRMVFLNDLDREPIKFSNVSGA